MLEIMAARADAFQFRLRLERAARISRAMVQNTAMCPALRSSRDSTEPCSTALNGIVDCEDK